MLPEDPVILFVQADRVLHDGWLAVIVGDRHVEILDMAETVAAEFERVGELAQSILPGIERAFPEMVGGRIGVGNDHVGDTGPVDDRPLALTIAKGDLVQHKTLARGPADAERPVLPADLPAVDREARAVLL